MKRILAVLLCAALLFAVPVTNGSGAEDTTKRDNDIAEINQVLAQLSSINRESREQLQQVQEKIIAFCYNHGYYQMHLMEDSIYKFDDVIAKYNKLLDYKEGDVNSDDLVNAKDALEVLKFAVGKAILNEKQKFAADVDYNNNYDAKDALMMMQFSVGKRQEFPSQVVDHTPFEKNLEYGLYSAKGASLYKNTYQTMVDRIRDDGYTNTSLTGAYQGMYLRDASIQTMAHVANGDYNEARMILNYITEYHRMKNLNYIMYIIRTNNAYHKQPDTTFFFLHAWYLFATKAPKTDENKAYIESSYAKIKQFANYYLDNGYLRSEYDLLYNESFEHSRDGSYWQSYDLVTNVYASQALHELAEYFKDSDPTNAKKWQDASTKIANGIHKNLTVEVKGATMYGEFYGTKKPNIEDQPETEKTFYAGFSWVNLAPMGCDWYAADPEILEHTYQMYLKYGSCRYYRGKTEMNYTMLEVYTNFKPTQAVPNRTGNHIIGKGLAWEYLYCHKTGKTDRLRTLNAFIEEFSDKYYPEVWAYSGGVNDTANQEQASWMLYAQKTVSPEISK